MVVSDSNFFFIIYQSDALFHIAVCSTYVSLGNQKELPPVGNIYIYVCILEGQEKQVLGFVP
jgi:hypothetical protein